MIQEYWLVELQYVTIRPYPNAVTSCIIIITKIMQENQTELKPRYSVKTEPKPTEIS